MLRLDKTITFSPILKSNLLVSFNGKRLNLDVLLFSIHLYTLLNRFNC